MKKFDYKKFLTVTNILMLIIVLFYIFDHYLPLPKNYTGFTWTSKDITAVDYLLGNCGGLLTNYLGVGKVLNYNSSQVYRYVTQMFLHGHLFHLIGNLVGLYFIGHYTEKRFGSIKSGRIVKICFCRCIRRNFRTCRRFSCCTVFRHKKF